MNAAENHNDNNSNKQDDASGLQQFHSIHSSNIELHNDRTLALREDAYKGNDFLYSKTPLAAGELFLVETERFGYFTMGLTNNPERHASDAFMNLYHVTNDTPAPHRSIMGDGAYLSTSRGLIPKTMLLPTERVKNSRVGLIYAATENDPTKAEIHFIFNGKQQGPAVPVEKVPLDRGPLYVAMGIYPNTKSIRIVQRQGVSTLQNSCRNVIREQFSINAISKLELPKSIKRFLLARDY